MDVGVVIIAATTVASAAAVGGGDMGCWVDDGESRRGEGGASSAGAGAGAGAGAANGGLAASSVSTLLGTAAPSSPFGLVAERSSIQAVGWLLMMLAAREWLELERPRHTAKQPALGCNDPPF